MFSHLSTSNSSASRLFRELDSGGATAATACWSSSQESLASLEEFSCLEVALDCLEDVASDNYQFVVEEMFLEAVVEEVSAELRRERVEEVAEQLVEATVRAQTAACCFAALSSSAVVNQPTAGRPSSINKNSNNNHWSSRIDNNNDTTFCDLDLDYEGCRMAEAEWLCRPIADALERLFEGWCTGAVEEICLETLVELVSQRLVQVLYKSSRSKSQFECRIVKALGRFNQTLGRLASSPKGGGSGGGVVQQRLDAGRIVDGFFNCVVDTVADPDSRRATSAMSGLLLAAAQDEAGGDGGARDAWRLLGIARAAFVRSVRGQLTRMAEKSQSGGGGGSSRRHQQKQQQQQAALAACLLDVGAGSSSDELESLPSETESSSFSVTPPPPPPLPPPLPRSGARKSSNSSRGTTARHQRCFPNRLERISEASQPPMKLSAAVEIETNMTKEAALPIAVLSAEEAVEKVDFQLCSRLLRIGASSKPAQVGIDFVGIRQEAIELALAGPAIGQSGCEEAAAVLALLVPTVGHACVLLVGRSVVGATLATVGTAGPSLLACSLSPVDACCSLTLPATVGHSDASADAFSMPEFAPAAAPTVAPVLSGPTVQRARPAMRLARCRSVLQRLDATPQASNIVRLARTQLALAAPATDRCAVEAPAICSVHAGIRPSRGHCCPLHQLPEPTPTLPGCRSASHLTANAALHLAPAEAIRLSSATQPTIGGRAVGLANGAAAARSAAEALRIGGVGVEIGAEGLRPADSSRQLPATERAPASADDRPELWLARPVRGWQQARPSTGRLRPALQPISSESPLSASASLAPMELFDAGGSLGADLLAPIEAPAGLAIGEAGSPPAPATDCRLVDCCRLEAERVGRSDRLHSPALSEPPPSVLSCSVSTVDGRDFLCDDDAGGCLATIIAVKSIVTVGLKVDGEDRDDDNDEDEDADVDAVSTSCRNYRQPCNSRALLIGRSRSVSSSGSSTASSFDGLLAPRVSRLVQQQQQLQELWAARRPDRH